MDKSKIVTAVYITFIALLICIGVYFAYNDQYNLLTGVATVTATVVLAFLSYRHDRTKLLIEQQKQRPFLSLRYYDGVNRLSVSLENKGLGLLIIKKYILSHLTTGNMNRSFYDILPSTSRPYDHYTANLENLVLPPGKSSQLFLFQLKDGENKSAFIEDANEIRQQIGHYILLVEYEDIFGNKMPRVRLDLSWFLRNFNQSNNLPLKSNKKEGGVKPNADIPTFKD